MKRFSKIYNFFRSGYHWACNLGFDFVQFHFFLKGVVPFYRDRRKLKIQLKSQTDFKLKMSYPCLADRFDSSGIMSGHYFHQDLLIAQRIYEAKPIRHVDIGSRIDGFVAHIAVFCKVEIFDIRIQKSSIDNIVFRQADLMELRPELMDYCESISSLHAIEHFGLGRYSDPVDVDGHKKAFGNVYQMLKTGGVFYFSVPMGPLRIEFNAHRVFSLAYLLRLFKDRFKIEYFSYVDDNGDLHKHITLTDELIKNNCRCFYGCAIFELRKI
jgi:SAM-dependent methyltransferase